MKLFTSNGVPLLAAWDVSLDMLFILPAWEQVVGKHPDKSIVTGPLAKELEFEFAQAGHIGYIHGNTGRIMSLSPRYGEKAYERYHGETTAIMAAWDYSTHGVLYIGPIGSEVYSAASCNGVSRLEISKDFQKRGLLGVIVGKMLHLPPPWESQTFEDEDEVRAEAAKEEVVPDMSLAEQMTKGPPKLIGAWENDILWIGVEGALVTSEPYPLKQSEKYYDGNLKGETAKQLAASDLIHIGVIREDRLCRE